MRMGTTFLEALLSSRRTIRAGKNPTPHGRPDNPVSGNEKGVFKPFAGA
jgi:hypothetical protein